MHDHCGTVSGYYMRDHVCLTVMFSPRGVQSKQSLQSCSSCLRLCSCRLQLTSSWRSSCCSLNLRRMIGLCSQKANRHQSWTRHQVPQSGCLHPRCMRLVGGTVLPAHLCSCVPFASVLTCLHTPSWPPTFITPFPLTLPPPFPHVNLSPCPHLPTGALQVSAKEALAAIQAQPASLAWQVPDPLAELEAQLDEQVCT